MLKVKFIFSTCFLLLFCFMLTPTPISLAEETEPQPGHRDVCFKHKVRDTVKTDCIEILGKHDAHPVYECFDEDEEDYVVFEPDNKEWEKLDGDNPDCMPEPPKEGIDPPKGGDDENP